MLPSIHHSAFSIRHYKMEGEMSDKERQKKDGGRKERKNERRRERENEVAQEARPPHQARDESNLTDTQPGPPDVWETRKEGR